MGSQKFINPDNEKQSVEIEECKLDKKIVKETYKNKAWKHEKVKITG